MKYLLSISWLRPFVYVLLGTHILVFLIGRYIGSRRAPPSIHHHYTGPAPKRSEAQVRDDRIGAGLRVVLWVSALYLAFVYRIEIGNWFHTVTNT